MFSAPSGQHRVTSRTRIRSAPRTCCINARENWSWPAGTGVCVVKMHCERIASRSSSVAAPSSGFPSRVFRQVRVEQIDRNLVPENSANRIFPRPEMNLPPFDFYRSSCTVLLERPLGMPLRIFFELIAPRIEPLTKVAPAVDQRYADHRSSEVSSGTERVPSQNTQASAVGWNPGL